MNNQSQRGGGSLAALLAVLFTGMLALSGWQRFMDASLSLIEDEQRYLSAFHQAESALSWGARQHWRGTEGQCLRPPAGDFQACLLAGAGGRWILRGHGEGLDEPLYLYHVMAMRGAGPQGRDGASWRLAPLPGGWLDYHPG